MADVIAEWPQEILRDGGWVMCRVEGEDEDGDPTRIILRDGKTISWTPFRGVRTIYTHEVFWHDKWRKCRRFNREDWAIEDVSGYQNLTPDIKPLTVITLMPGLEMAQNICERNDEAHECAADIGAAIDLIEAGKDPRDD